MANKKYVTVYLSFEAKELMDDIVYSKKMQGDLSYSNGDAVSEGLQLLKDTVRIKKRPK